MTMFCRAIATLSIAVLTLTTTLAQAPDSKTEARNALNSGVVAFKASRPQEAVDLFNRALQFDPDLKVVELYLAAAYSSLVTPGVTNAETQEFVKKATDLYERIIQREPANVEALTGLGGLYSRSNNLQKVREVFLRITRLAIGDPLPFYTVASTDWLLSRNKTIAPAERGTLVSEGMANVDIALAMNPQYVDAMTYKNLLLREQADITSDPQKRESLIQEANSWFQKALDARSRPQTAAVRPGASGTVGVGIGGPPPPGVGAIGGVVGGVPGGVRGGVPGGIIAATLAPPTPPPPPSPPSRVGPEVAQANLVSSVVPVYPPQARSAGVQGVVMLQATINRQGGISDLRVISGHTLLQEAAIEAVKKWRYKPMLLNGEPIEVITTITVNFVLQ